MLATLSTGLHKSDEFIKENATDMYTRIVTFSNGRKVRLNEETSIPRAVEGTVRYLRCDSITYPSDYDVCHRDLVVRTNETRSIISCRDVNAYGLVSAVSRAIMPRDVYITTADVRGNQYNGIRLSWDPARIYRIDMTYLTAWLFAIIPTYDYGEENKFCPIYDNIQLPPVNLLGYDVSTGITKRILFPLLNGGIHRMTVSCEDLATSQYINGHKTATIAETPLMPSLQVKFPNVPNWQQDVINYFLTPHPQAPQGSIFPDLQTSSPYYSNVAPACIPYLRCNLNQYSNVIDPVAINMEDGVAKVVTTGGDRVGEIRIKLPSLLEVSFKWMIEVYQGNTYDRRHKHHVTTVYQNTRVNFCLVQDDGTYDESTAVMQSKMHDFCWGTNVDNSQSGTHRFDYYIDLNDPAVVSRKFLAIRHYVYELEGHTAFQPITAKLILTPLDESQTHVDFIRRKYPDRNTVGVVVPGSTLGGVNLTRTSLVVSRHSLHKAFVDETPNSVVFNHHDSPWLECTTATKISSLLFHVQDEYGQDLKKATEPNKTIKLTVSFADVPKSSS